MPDLLLELLSEEIPARMQERARADLRRLVLDGLGAAGLAHQDAKAFSTPRRLTLAVEGVAARSADTCEERKGPRVGAPDKAIDGFLRAAGLSSLDQCEIRDDGKGAYHVAVIERPGKEACDIIAEVVEKAVRSFPWAKSMRWSDGQLKWVRPLHSVLATFGAKTETPDVIELAIDGIVAGNVTRGHRMMAPSNITVMRFDDYVAKLQSANVEIDSERRRETILEDARSLAVVQGLELIDDPALADEVAGLVEWPVTLIGTFDIAFLELPAEVLATTMRVNQKYFALKNAKTGEIANRFIVVANIEAGDGGAAIVAGNERVLSARLHDARFFWEQDLKSKLELHAAKLTEVVFHEQLGTQTERIERIAALARELAPLIGADANEAERAAQLAKADLMTEMVGEFPELQGVMGRYYALKQNETEAVADGIRDHYRPQGPSDEVPSEPVSMTVALADKIDLLVGFWAIDEKPTGSKDPFALRRAALGVIRIVLENELRVQLNKAFGVSARSHYAGSALRQKSELDTVGLRQSLLAFFADRLKVHLRETGARHDLIDAVFSLGGQDDLLMIVRRVEALGDFLGTDDGANLLIGIKRAQNILRIEEKKDGEGAFEDEPDLKLISEDPEKQLFEAIGAAAGEVEAAVKLEDFADAMRALAKLRGPVDRFFDEVTVNADDPALRVNRLKLLNLIRRATLAIADFSKIEG